MNARCGFRLYVATLSILSGACGGPDFVTQSSGGGDGGANEAGPEARPPIICTNCGDPSPPPNPADDGGDATVEAGDGRANDLGDATVEGGANDADAGDEPHPPLLEQGGVCKSDSECAAGLSCADGVCCDKPCTGSCEQCNLGMLKGTCSPVPQGQVASAPHVTCPTDNPSSCQRDGKCDGKGSCERWPNGTVCAQASCDAVSNRHSNESTCDGAGACTAGTTGPCDPFRCALGGTSCATTCTTGSDCVSPTPCQNSSCGTVSNGSQCTTDTQCTSGHCVDRFCCDKPCAGSCEACDLAGQQGTCSLVPSGQPHGSRVPCAGTGACQGSCSTAQTCTYSTATCAAASCTSGTQSLAAACDGAGSCSSQSQVSCKGFACNGTGCYTTCSGDPQCVSPTPYCNGSACQSTAPLGHSCTTDGQCATGQCCGGACVDTTSDGHNCGSCGHDCLGGGCSMGNCEPFVITTTPSSGQLLVDANALYVTNTSTPALVIEISKTGVLRGAGGTNVQNVFAQDDMYVYVVYFATSFFTIGRVLKSPFGSLSDVLNNTDSSDLLNNVAVTGSETYYIMNELGTPMGIQSLFLGSIGASKDAGMPVHLDTSNGTTLAGDMNGIVWAQSTGALMAANPDFTTKTALATPASPSPGAIVLDATNAYWYNAADQKIYVSARGSSLPTACTSSATCALVVSALAQGPAQLALDAGFVYWSDGAAGTISRVSITATAPAAPTTLATGQSGAGAIAVDATAIYWSNGSAITKLAK